MSLLLSGLIHFFRPLLSSLSGVFDCRGVGPWYFLTGLRIMAVFLFIGPWDSLKVDIACSWVAPMEDKSRDFCTTLCQNQHFPFSVSAAWGVVMIAVLLLVGLMRLSSPRKKKKKEEASGSGSSSSSEKTDDKALPTLPAASRGSSANTSTAYTVGHGGLPRHYGYPGPQSHYSQPFYHNVWHNWNNQYGIPMAQMPERHGTNVGLGPLEVGGYGMPSHPGYIDTSQYPMNAYPTYMPDPKMTSYCPEPDQYGMTPKDQTNVAPYFNETQHNNAPTNYASVPMSSSSYTGKMPPHVWSEDKNDKGLQQRYRGPREYAKSIDCAYTMGRKYTGKSKTIPRCYEGNKGSLATKCKTISESNVDKIAAHPRLDGMNMAIKHRPVPGSKMKTKQQLTLDATDRSEICYGNKMCPQPWMADDSNCRPPDGNKIMTGLGTATGLTPSSHGDAACVCPENNPCHVGPSSQPQRDPGPSAESNPSRESKPGPQDEVKEALTNIYGVPLFDIWVGLLLTSEICFLCYIILLQMPPLIGRSWVCSPGAIGCPEAVECAVKSKAEKWMTLCGLAFTASLFIIACSGYFYLRFCWSGRFCLPCNENVGRQPGACAECTAPVGRVIRGNVESAIDDEEEEGL